MAAAERSDDVVAITAAMPGPTGLLPFEAKYPERFLDVGIAEQHAVTAAAGMAMAGLRPVVAVYSTFFSRAFDQANLDVGLHRLPVVFVLDRAGITGDDGPSHHGILDLAPGAGHPGHDRLRPVVGRRGRAHARHGPDARRPRRSIRFPKTPRARSDPRASVTDSRPASSTAATGPSASWPWARWWKRPRRRRPSCAADGIDATVWDVRVVSPPDPDMLLDAAAHGLVVTVEDGIRVGGAGTFLLDAMRCLPGTDRPQPPVRILGVPRSYIAQGKPDRILAELGLDGPGIAVGGDHGPGRRARASPLRLTDPTGVRGSREARPRPPLSRDRNLF